MTFRQATMDDCARLAVLNHRLIQDEGHRNRMTVPELEQRMRDWLASGYCAVLFGEEKAVAAYALYREMSDEVHLRQLFVARDRRRQGLGRQVVGTLRSNVWPRDKRLTVEVLVRNTAALAFWRAVGYTDYSLTLERPPES